MHRSVQCLRCRSTKSQSLTQWTRNFADARRPIMPPKAIIDLKHIRAEPDLYQQTCQDRNYPRLANNPMEILSCHRESLRLHEEGRVLRNRSKELRRQLMDLRTNGSDLEADEAEKKKETILEEARSIKEELSRNEIYEENINLSIEELAYELPNLTDEETPEGEEPELLSYINEMPDHKDTPETAVWRSHVHIGTELGLLDFTSASITSGWGFYYLVGEAAQLEQALVQYALAVVTQFGWTQVAPPSLVYTHIGAACGFNPRDYSGEQQVYTIAREQSDVDRGVPEMCLTGTAEIPLAGMKANAKIAAKDLPIKRVAVSRSYRAEAGARGADTKGLYRVHEFTKVEMFAWSMPDRDEAKDVFDEMLDIQTEILTSLGLHCRILSMPAHDLGASASRKVDMEAFFPSRRSISSSKGWGEVTSASICTDYQTRRLGTRLRASGSEKLGFPWTLNGTALAVPRIIAALLENGWDPETKTVVIPECLRPWMGGKERMGLGRRNKALDEV